MNQSFETMARDNVRDFDETNILPQPPAILSQINQWLCPTDYAAVTGEYCKHLTSHLAGTCTWLYSTDAYQQWHDSDVEGLLWIKGIPGSGKSVFAASLVHRLQQEEVPVLYFFFRQIIRANHEPTTLLRDWLTQILPYSPPLQARLKEYLDGRRTVESLSITDMFKDLRLACTYLPKVYCVTDAVDEMNEGNGQFLHELAQFGCWRPSKVKTIITSRPMPTVEIPLRSHPMVQVRLEERLVDKDIAIYVQSLLDGSDISEEDRARIKQAVPGRANGLFLYAKLAMEQFMEPGADVQHVLAALPADLNAMYTDLLREHSRRSGIPPRIQLLILQWVTHASRPLRLLEIAEMLSVTHQLDEVRELKEAKDLVRATCGSLLEILPDETVSVVHHSLTEFLNGSTRSLNQRELMKEEYPVLEFGPTHAGLALACLSYLNSGCLDNCEVKVENRYQDFWKPRKLDQRLRLEYPFAEYATLNWHVHATKAQLTGTSQPELGKMLDEFLHGNRFLVWLSLEWPGYHIDGVYPLHVAARFGLTESAQELLEQPGANVNAAAAHDETAVYWAAYEGHDETLGLLLQHGADPNKNNGVGLTPLHEAARHNHPAAAQALLAAGVDPLTPRTDPEASERFDAPPTSVGRTPLEYACRNGHEEVVAVFLPFLKDIKIVYEALRWAAEYGRANVVKRILKHPGVDANAFLPHNTALFYACIAFDPQTIEVLIKAGANPNVMERSRIHPNLIKQNSTMDLDRNKPDSKRELTALHMLCDSVVGGHKPPSADIIRECFELLRESGVNIDQRDSQGKTALHGLLSGISVGVSKAVCVMLRLLLDAGADANTETDDGGTLLHGNPYGKDVIRMLVEEGGVDINRRRSSDGKTPLLCILASQSPEASLEFLSFGPDCNVVDNDGNSPLHVALNSWKTNPDLIAALLASGADPNLKNHKGQTALHIVGEQDGLFRLMVESGADLEVQDNEGHTVLFQRVTTSVRHADPNIAVKAAVELGAKIDCRDYKGRTLLHEAVRYDSNDRLRYFLDLGLSPYVQDLGGNSLWHEAIFARSYPTQGLDSRWHNQRNQQIPDMYDTLVEIGVDSDQSNHQGRTPLHIACSIDVDVSMSPYGKLPVDYLLSICKNKSPADFDGITPLHLAATISEYHVAALLRAGANTTAVTLEGLTPLHLAARACQPNIVGMLLKEYERAGNSTGSTPLDLINYLDNSGRTALHYACRSGRPETVALLLASGANVNIRAEGDVTPLLECAQFESEQEFWRGCGSAIERHDRLQAAGLKLDDDSRPHIYRTDSMLPKDMEIPSGHISARLEEILDMLVAHGADVDTTDASGRNQLQVAISSIKSSSTGYALKCFLALIERLNPRLYESDAEYLLSLRRQAEMMAASKESAPKCTLHRHCGGTELDTLLASRNYGRIEIIHREGTDFTQPSQTSESDWHTLVCGGYGRLLAKLCTPEVANKFEDAKWCKKWQKIAKRDAYFNAGTIRPLLIAACSTSTPNMEVVKVLVETIKVNVNAHDLTGFWDQRYGQMGIGVSALHILAKGHHWWQVHQALPYLISQGANVEVKDDQGRTPLHIAIENSLGDIPRSSLLQEEAVRLLVSAGANINAMNKMGMSCQTLAVTHNNPEMIRILLPPGVRPNVGALFIAIEECNVKLFERLLSYGIDSNQRCDIKILNSSGYQVDSGIERPDGKIEQDELYAVLLIDDKATKAGDTNTFLFGQTANEAGNKQKYIDMMKLLISHGTDIYATFRKTVPDIKSPLAASAHANRMADDAESGGTGKRPPQGHHFEDCTIIHDLLESSRFVQDIIDWESLDLERRDAKGRTLLLAACRNRSVTSTMAATRLIEQGADLSARDNKGKNVLHQIFEVHASSAIYKRDELVKLMLSKRPELVHEEDSKGNTPINCVQPGSNNMIIGFFMPDSPRDVVDILLDAGSDPLHPGADGNFPIHLLGARPRHTLFQRFLNMGVPINIRNTKNGNTPLFSWFASQPLNLDRFQSRSQRSNISVPFGVPFGVPLDTFTALQSQKPPVEQAELEEFERDQLAFYEEAGADFMARNDAGETLLHVLAGASYQSSHFVRSREEVLISRFRFLVAKGLDPMAEDGRQRTALDIAVACDNTFLLELFKK